MQAVASESCEAAEPMKQPFARRGYGLRACGAFGSEYINDFIMKIKEITDVIERFARLEWQEGYDLSLIHISEPTRRP